VVSERESDDCCVVPCRQQHVASVCNCCGALCADLVVWWLACVAAGGCQPSKFVCMLLCMLWVAIMHVLQRVPAQGQQL
jgi:hypothetical protein